MILKWRQDCVNNFLAKTLFLFFFFCVVPLSGALIVLDPGHGGKDEGARVHNVFEKKLTLRTAYLVKKELELLGHRVILTRARDLYVSLVARAEMASRRSADLFVSLHYNSSKSPAAQGLEIYYYGKGEATRAEQSRLLASLLVKKIVRATSCHSRGVKRGNFHVIRETTKMPAVLIEGGFLTNDGERGLFTTPAYLEKFAKAVADGIDEFALKNL
jgi:N-acetylmuramoyl-L-alanine amidase